ncbi:Neprilysin-11 [Portunus trituberculatus]|uniref:Neprilysin-11 n=1 Tax=Portunus trituberculatus TaxID=210409 RepID=A0A5B7DM70_PORTR|nr:Neprilysin-11 [Portunus trituberculatus]
MELKQCAVSLLEHLPPNTCTSSLCHKAGLLEKNLQEDEPHVIKVTKTVYQACVNESQWEAAGAMPLLILLKREGGLPMIEPDWNEEKFNVMKMLSRMRRTLANEHLISVTVQPDSKNTSNNVININQGRLTLRREYYTPDTPLSRYHKATHISLMKQAGEFLLKAQKQEQNVTFLNNLYRDVEDLWEFSVKVAEITELMEHFDPWQLYNPTTVKELQAHTDATNSTFKIMIISIIIMNSQPYVCFQISGKEKLKNTLQMVEDVTAAFRDMLVEASWIDPATLKEALHKLDEMQHLVAFPPLAIIDDLLEEYHQGFMPQIPEVKKNDHFGNMLALTAWQCHRTLHELTSPESRDSWPRGPLEINAFYSAFTNAIGKS